MLVSSVSKGKMICCFLLSGIREKSRGIRLTDERLDWLTGRVSAQYGLIENIILFSN
jgi:ATP-dependent protease ClpP protease subunit